jgi:septal ring factor EnvC (AmiA/AmiB activator)
MPETPSKEQVLIRELLQKLDAERCEVARLKSELSQYKESAKMRKEYEAKLQEKDSVIQEQDKIINKLNRELAWLRRKFWGKSSERHVEENDGQLSFDFGELKLSPEEEAAYKKAEAEAQAYQEQRKTEAEKRHAKNKPVRKPLPENIRREVVEILPIGYNPEEWELLPESFDEVTGNSAAK